MVCLLHYVHHNLGLDSVLNAYVSYMHSVLDQLNPKMFENLDWLKPPTTWSQELNSFADANPYKGCAGVPNFSMKTRHSQCEYLNKQHVMIWFMHHIKQNWHATATKRNCLNTKWWELMPIFLCDVTCTSNQVLFEHMHALYISVYHISHEFTWYHHQWIWCLCTFAIFTGLGPSFLKETLYDALQRPSAPGSLRHFECLSLLKIQEILRGSDE